MKVIDASSIAVLALLATARLAVGAPVGPAPTSGEGELQVLGGEMVYFADAATFLECMTGRSYPIAMEGDYLALERAYGAAADPPGSPLYVTLEGVLADRARMEGDGTERAVVVRRFINVWPGQRCERAAAHASLANTYWRVVRLQGAPVRSEEGEREPHIVLRDVDGRREYTAVTGCRRLAGPYSSDADEIEFGPPTSAPVSCPSSLAAFDRSLTNALAAVTGWRIHAQTLEFYDASGAPVALLEAVYLR